MIVIASPKGARSFDKLKDGERSRTTIPTRQRRLWRRDCLPAAMPAGRQGQAGFVANACPEQRRRAPRNDGFISCR